MEQQDRWEPNRRSICWCHHRNEGGCFRSSDSRPQRPLQHAEPQQLQRPPSTEPKKNPPWNSLYSHHQRHTQGRSSILEPVHTDTSMRRAGTNCNTQQREKFPVAGPVAIVSSERASSSGAHVTLLDSLVLDFSAKVERWGEWVTATFTASTWRWF